ncbi:aldose 1-epimerase family protein [Bradyrhizobium sp. STM 3557]|uniref:aldose 1-epimerase family protein n=1 Tax=Bradyrhizobium sp. STM 3557 TaxID=578920 RepID=UPI003890F1D0
MTNDIHTFSAGGLTASIKADGAELCSLKTGGGLELLWQAGPAWPRHAPWLFPIVGRLKDDQLRHRGKTYPMTQHGFARDLRFEWLERTAQSCSLQLTDGEATRARYPFAFRLTIAYRVAADRLEASIEIANPGTEVLPASFGAHPAFNWPLMPGEPKSQYRLVFPQAEPAPIRRLSGGLLREQPEPSPVQAARVPLSEDLFAGDAVILDSIKSRSVRYEGERGPSIEIGWNGFRELGIWSKPGGAPFLCIEPWRGYASPLHFDDEFTDKPGLMHIARGGAEILTLRIQVHEAV